MAEEFVAGEGCDDGQIPGDGLVCGKRGARGRDTGQVAEQIGGAGAVSFFIPDAVG